MELELDMAMLSNDEESAYKDRALVSFWWVEKRNLYGREIEFDRLVAGMVVLRPSGDLVITEIVNDGGTGAKVLDHIKCAIETGKIYGDFRWARWHSGRGWAERMRAKIAEGKAAFPK